MPDDVVRARRRLVAAMLLVVAVAVGLGTAYYLLDGGAVVEDVLAGRLPWETPPSSEEPTGSVPATSTADPLAGLPDDFIARVWQEQVESQESIGLLISGDVTALTVGSSTVEADEAALRVTAYFRDGTSADGAITFRRFGSEWFVLGAEGMRAPGTAGHASAVAEAGSSSEGPLPPMSEVDRTIVATIVTEQRESQSTIDEYLTGAVQRIDVTGVTDGPGTRTLKIRMTESHEISDAEIVCVASGRGDTTRWFIARFAKTGSTAK